MKTSHLYFIAFVAFANPGFEPPAIAANNGHTADPRQGGTACTTECPPGAIVETEPACGPDSFNPNPCPQEQVTELPCGDNGVAACGTFGFFAPNDSTELADFDTYEFTLVEARTVTACVCGPQYSFLELVDSAHPCVLVAYGSNDNVGEPACCTVTLSPGTYRIDVGDIYSAPCGSAYVLHVDGLYCPTVPVELVPWSRIKSRYR